MTFFLTATECDTPTSRCDPSSAIRERKRTGSTQNARHVADRPLARRALENFLTLTGPKTDLWLVRAFGLLVAAIGGALLAFSVVARAGSGAFRFGMASAVALASSMSSSSRSAPFRSSCSMHRQKPFLLRVHRAEAIAQPEDHWHATCTRRGTRGLQWSLATS